MRYWLILRWVEGKAKLHGKTIRRSPSEMTWDLVLEDGTWYRFADDPREAATFAIEWKKGTAEDRVKLAKSCWTAKGKPKTEVRKPGEFGNETKDAFTFFMGLQKGQLKVYEDTPRVKRYKIGSKFLTLTAREGVKGQWRSEWGKGGPGPRKMQLAMPLRFSAQAVIERLAGADERTEYRVRQDPKVRFVKDGDTWRIEWLAIAVPGIWNGITLSEERLKRMVETYRLVKHRHVAPLKLGHNNKLGAAFATYDETGEPALGWMEDVWWDDEDRMLRATFVKVPGVVVEAIRRGAYTGVSPEIEPDLSGYADVIVGVALLGADIPAITSLPRLLELYHREDSAAEAPVVPIAALIKGGDGSMEEKLQNDAAQPQAPENTDVGVSVDALLQVAPEARVLFFAKEPEGKKELVALLKEKGYPTVLAEEIIDLMPEPTKERVEALPPYDEALWKPRLETLKERVKYPEKCEKIVKELEEFLEMHGDELDEDFKKEVLEVLKQARENLPEIEVEEQEEAEKYPETSPNVEIEDQAELPEKERYPQYPKYPKAEMAKEGEDEAGDEDEVKQSAEFARMRELLRRRALEAVDAKVEAFAAKGFPPELLAQLREAMIELDPDITPNPDRAKLQRIIMTMIEHRAPRQTFSRIVQEEYQPPQALAEELADLIVRAAPSAGMKEKQD